MEEVDTTSIASEYEMQRIIVDFRNTKDILRESRDRIKMDLRIWRRNNNT